MHEHVVGRTPRLTAYFCGIALGLSLLVVGLEATRVFVIGAVPPAVFVAYAAIGILGGFLLSFVAGYLNGSLLASWAAGFVPASSRVAPVLTDGSLRRLGVELVGALGVAVLIGSVGFAVAVEKHRLDARNADLPEPIPRIDLVGLVTGSALLGITLATVPALI